MRRKRVEKKHGSKRGEKMILKQTKKCCCHWIRIHAHKTVPILTCGFYSTMQNRLSHLHATDPIFAIFSRSLICCFCSFFSKWEKSNQIFDRVKSEWHHKWTLFRNANSTSHVIFSHCLPNGNNTALRMWADEILSHWHSRFHINCKLMSLMLIACLLFEFCHSNQNWLSWNYEKETHCLIGKNAHPKPLDKIALLSK